MSTHRAEHFQLGTRSRNTRMIHLIYLHRNTIVRSGKGIVRNIELETAEHSHNIIFIGYKPAVNPDVRPIVNAVKGQPYFLTFIRFGQSDFRTIPIRVLPRVSSTLQIVIFSQIHPGIELVRNIGD